MNRGWFVCCIKLLYFEVVPRGGLGSLGLKGN